LTVRLLERKKIEEQLKISGSRNAQIHAAERAEKIRTYNFPQDRITDHRIKQNFSNIEGVMLGDFSKILEAFYDYKTNNPDSNF